MAIALLNDSPGFRHFTCTSTYHRFLQLKITDGAKHLVENHGGFGYFLVIAKAQEELEKQSFQHWRLERMTGCFFGITVDDGNGNVLCSMRVELMGFMGDAVRLYVIDGTVLLPSEY
ncbi:DUF6876 family protein [Parapedobacter soli]|uniref:DUF6876 family protein n=1 Tax=Parapedobacter soli TaxID=416955 RepID=UPI0021C96AC2|nr:DUF6876 family protein [Parapedobacter soli]